MVIKNKPVPVPWWSAGSGVIVSRGRAPPPQRDVIVVRPTTAPASSSKPSRSVRERVLEPGDVIDLGAPRALRAARDARPSLQRPSYVPNPRLYPGPERARPRAPPKRVDSRGGGEGRGRRRKRACRRAAPNARLYTPAARRAPPPAVPRAAWAPPAPQARLDTASRVALRFSELRRGPRPPPQPFQAPAPPLVVTLPPLSPAAPRHYEPASAHFQLRSLDAESGESTPAAAPPEMDAANRKSTSPEDCSDGNETLSAPSEFLAEFLSAIMRRQYAEALKYCRLILQYEPHNATARGFYPLLQQKVLAQKRPDAARPRGSSSEEASAPAQHHEMMEQGGDSSESEGEEGGASHSCSRSGDSCRSQSSLELDSSEAAGHSSPSLSPSRRTERTERTERTDSASAGAWESTGSASRSDTDDNGNATGAAGTAPPCAGDLANDNAEPCSAEASALRRLRAQFACSIK